MFKIITIIAVLSLSLFIKTNAQTYQERLEQKEKFESELKKKYDDVKEATKGYIVVKDKKYGLIAPSGKIKLDVKYDNIVDHRYAMVVTQNNKCAVYSFYGNLSPFNYDLVTGFVWLEGAEHQDNQTVAIFEINGKKGYVNGEGKILISGYDGVQSLREIKKRQAFVRNGDKYGIVNIETGRFTAELKYSRDEMVDMWEKL